MIVSQSAKPHICLRCQLILKRQYLPFSIQLAQKSTETLGQFNEEHKSLITKVSLERKPDFSHYSNNAKFQADGKPIYPPHGSDLVERVELIKEKTGNPTKIIILREIPTSMERDGPDFEGTEEIATSDENTIPEEIPTQFDIIDKIENERALVETHQVISNIDEIRPKDELLQDLKDFDALVDQLTDGFTSLQLEQYIKNFESKNTNEEVPKSAPVSNEELLSSISQWRPGISTDQENFDNGSKRGFSLQSRSPKELIAIHLMLECWKLEVSSIMEGLGQFEIQLGASTLEVLLSGNPPHLQTFLDRVLTMEGERLEVFRFRNTIRITTAKSRMYLIVNEMKNLVNKIEIRSISLADLMPPRGLQKWNITQIKEWTSKIFNDHALAKIKSLTGVVISRYSNSKIFLSSFPKESLSRESPNDTARRLLLTARPKMLPKTQSLASADKSNTVPVHYFQIDGLNWWCRTRKWLRWVTPVPKESKISTTIPLTESPISYLSSSYEDITSQPNIGSLTSVISKNKSSSNSKKIPKLFTSTFATFGAVIHTHFDPHSRRTASIYRNQKKFITEFSPHVPNVTLVLSFAEFDQTARMEERVILRFLPNPFSQNCSISNSNKSLSRAARFALPHIELNFRMDRKKRAKYAFAKAVIGESRTDVMLPQETVDIRFHQQTTGPLSEEGLETIKKFIGRFELDFSPGGKITIPPSIELPIPVYLCQKEELNLLKLRQGLAFKFPERLNDLIEGVEYLFSGLEIRKRLVFKYKSWNLDYTYINAGKSGGTRGELSLRPIKNGKVASDQDFIDFALELACRITSFSTPDLTRFRAITKVESPLVRKYVPVHQPNSDYPRSYLYIPRRVLCDETPDQTLPSKSNISTPSDSMGEARAFEDELDDIDIFGGFDPIETDFPDLIKHYQSNQLLALDEDKKSFDYEDEKENGIP